MTGAAIAAPVSTTTEKTVHANNKFSGIRVRQNDPRSAIIVVSKDDAGLLSAGTFTSRYMGFRLRTTLAALGMPVIEHYGAQTNSVPVFRFYSSQRFAADANSVLATMQLPN